MLMNGELAAFSVNLEGIEFYSILTGRSHLSPFVVRQITYWIVTIEVSLVVSLVNDLFDRYMFKNVGKQG
jgi:hypothetical protein